MTPDMVCPPQAFTFSSLTRPLSQSSQTPRRTQTITVLLYLATGFVLLAAIVPRAECMHIERGDFVGRALTRQAFDDLSCNGTFNSTLFSTLNSICNRCYWLYQEPEYHGLCRSECFTTSYFHGCLVVRMMEESAAKYSADIAKFAGRPLTFLHPDNINHTRRSFNISSNL